MWAGIFILIGWVVGPNPPPLAKTGEAPIRFSSEADAKRFLHFLLSMWAQGQLSDELLAELLRKYQLQDPCLCGECRARAHAAQEDFRQQHQKRQQEHEQRQREQQAREECQQQKQQQKWQRDQQRSTDCHDKFDGMMGFGSQTLPPDACPAVRSVLQGVDYYAVLGLSSSDYSTADEFDQQLRSARRRAAQAVHPDKVGSSGHIAASRVNLAYDTLSDDVSRGQFDAYLRRCRRGS